jgi:hypothetical protein
LGGFDGFKDRGSECEKNINRYEKDARHVRSVLWHSSLIALNNMLMSFCVLSQPGDMRTAPVAAVPKQLWTSGAQCIPARVAMLYLQFKKSQTSDEESPFKLKETTPFRFSGKVYSSILFIHNKPSIKQLVSEVSLSCN